MSHSTDLSTTPSGPAAFVSANDADLVALCDKIRIAEGPSAKLLPAQVLSYLAKSLSRIEIDIYVEECLPMVCDASHAFVRAMGTFSDRHADCDAVEQTRVRLIQALETLADEVHLCKVLVDPPVQRVRLGAAAKALIETEKSQLSAPLAG